MKPKQSILLLLALVFFASASIRHAHAFQWPKAIAGPGDDLGRMALDSQGNVYIAGAFEGAIDFGGGLLTAPHEDGLYVVKYSPEGEHLWSFATGSDQETPFFGNVDIAVDAQGNVYIARLFFGTINLGGADLTSNNTQEDYFIAKFDTDGQHLWSFQHGVATATEAPVTVAIDSLQNFLVAGFYSGTGNFGGDTYSSLDTDAFIAAYDSTGEHIWSFGQGGTAGEHPERIGLSASGDILLTGSSGEGPNIVPISNFGGDDIVGEAGDPGGFFGFYARYNAEGSHVDSRGFFSTANSASVTKAYVDESGNTFISGSFSGDIDLGGGSLPSRGESDVYLVKYNAQGGHEWSVSHGGDGAVFAISMIVDTDYIYLSGSFSGAANFGGRVIESVGGSDIFVAKYDLLGEHQWSFGLGDSTSNFSPQLLLHQNDLYVSGAFQDSIDLVSGNVDGAGQRDLFIAKYDATRPVAVNTEPVETPPAFLTISSVYPNPFTQRLSLSINNERAQHIRLEVFNMIGQRVALLHDGLLHSSAPHRFVFDAADYASGHYLIRATGEYETATSMVSLLR